ncbi:MAG TPA: DUF3850 domain-containing protein [archaeon]|nr:DUF3850 domain-containing protein [archaeon]
MARIEKKTLPEFFEKVLSGDKTFEVRLADWECQPGDTLVLREYSPEKGYTGRVIEKKVTYVLKTKAMETWFTSEEIAKHGFQVIAFK